MAAILSRPQCVKRLRMLLVGRSILDSPSVASMGFGCTTSGPWFNIKMMSYRYRKSHCGDKTVVRSSYLHSGISYTGKMTSLYWVGALVPFFKYWYQILYTHPLWYCLEVDWFEGIKIKFYVLSSFFSLLKCAGQRSANLLYVTTKKKKKF